MICLIGKLSFAGQPPAATPLLLLLQSGSLAAMCGDRQPASFVGRVHYKYNQKKPHLSQHNNKKKQKLQKKNKTRQKNKL